MNKYKILFDSLKEKVGPDPARLIVYDVFCNDSKYVTYDDKYEKRDRILVKIYKKCIERMKCGPGFIIRLFDDNLMTAQNNLRLYPATDIMEDILEIRKSEYDGDKLSLFGQISFKNKIRGVMSLC